VAIAEQLADTTVDVIVAGHTHRVANLMVGDILVTEGLNAGATYSVIQLMTRAGDVQWAGGATRVAKALGVPARDDLEAIVDDANAQSALLLDAVVGRQTADIRRDPARLRESAMGNLVADAMRRKYPGVEAALTNSGGLRMDLPCVPPSAGEGPCAITWGEVFAVLPFDNRTVIETLTGAQLAAALASGLAPSCNPAIATGRFPQLSGLVVRFHCEGPAAVLDGIWKAPAGPGGPLTAVGASDSVRLVTNDFTFGGGDGYLALMNGSNVLQPGDALLDIVVDEIERQSVPPSPGVSAAVEGRIIGP
jgi:2',3'-cyclic-nucleotide 2'-phosphodiesterase (5'-nucleotidase family)